MANNETLVKLTSLEVGGTITGTITGIEQGKYGPVIVLDVAGQGTTKVFPAGNIKRFFNDDQSKGMYNNGNTLTITRKEDAVLDNGMRVTQFVKTSKSGSKTQDNNSTTNKKAELQARLAASRKTA